jgi:type I restriction-modification system DNA methylase subunit
MDQAAHTKIVCFTWNIADDVLRNVFVRGKYRDVILPMCVLRRFVGFLEETKKAVLETKEMFEKAKITGATRCFVFRGWAGVLQPIQIHAARCQGTPRPAATSPGL